jgi:4'-phosphopantetheinyl transferase
VDGGIDQQQITVEIRPLAECSPSRLDLHHQVQLWVADLSDVSIPDEELLSALTPEERERGERYRSPRVREQFLRCRGLLRRLLAEYLLCPPSGVPLSLQADGKPILDGHSGVHFNVSHTDGMALFAVAARPVGVDVERIRPMPSAEALVSRFFSQTEIRQYESLPNLMKIPGFFRGWTCKEAVLKGIGCGSRDLDRAVVDLDPRLPARVIGPPETLAEWRVVSWAMGEHYAAALAVAVPEQTIELKMATSV